MTRLIDIDALDAEMYRKSFEVDDGRNVWNSGLWIRYKIYEEASRDAPTVDAVPVRHGEFIGTEYDGYADGNPVYCEWVCSECGCVFEDEEPTYRFCPNCGAKMDGKEEE